MAQLTLYRSYREAAVSYQVTDEFLDKLRERLDVVDGPLWLTIVTSAAGYKVHRVSPDEPIAMSYDRRSDGQEGHQMSDLIFVADGALTSGSTEPSRPR